MVNKLGAEGLPVLLIYLTCSAKRRESYERCLPLVQLAPRHKLTGQFAELLHRLEAVQR
jgi:chromosome partitioning protein